MDDDDAADPAIIWKHTNTAFLACTQNVEITAVCRSIDHNRCRAILQIEGPMNEAIDLKIVHNYGHGGAGVTLHWGCAGDTVALVRRLL